MTTLAPAEATTVARPQRELTYAEAIREALRQEMRRDPRVFLIGEDIGVYGGAFGVTGDLVHEFGKDRVRDTPIAEEVIAGLAVGAAITGMRPVAEIQFSDFVTLATEQIVNQAAKMRFMFGGKIAVPMVVRLPGGSGTGAAAQHSQSLEAWFAHIPGLKVVLPATPSDAKGLLVAAIRDPNPVMVFEHKLLYRTRGVVPEELYTEDLKAIVRRTGRDLTLVAYSVMVIRALEAAEQLAAEGIDVEVVDVRCLRPLDEATIVGSARRTGRVLVVHEAVRSGGFGGEIVARIVESEAFDFLDAPVRRLAGRETPIPYNRTLERSAVPQVEDIVAAARALVRE
ncbi:MAG: alpha-ketoacid dehydrogenase subunit beta [Chloroflexi bacterium OHK40]